MAKTELEERPMAEEGRLLRMLSTVNRVSIVSLNTVWVNGCVE
jgi:hypothetical protein